MNKYPYYIEVPFSIDVNTKEVVEWTTFEVKDKEDKQFVNYCYKQIAKPKEILWKQNVKQNGKRNWP